MISYNLCQIFQSKYHESLMEQRKSAVRQRVISGLSKGLTSGNSLIAEKNLARKWFSGNYCQLCRNLLLQLCFSNLVRLIENSQRWLYRRPGAKHTVCWRDGWVQLGSSYAKYPICARSYPSSHEARGNSRWTWDNDRTKWRTSSWSMLSLFMNWTSSIKHHCYVHDL